MSTGRRPDDTLPDRSDDGWLVVDVMNVVGSRPDGWWHDRTGAAADLVVRLRELAVTTGRAITAVVDGDPSARLPDGTDGGIEVIHAGRGPDAADDRIVRLLGERPTGASVVTADRDLRDRARRAGAAVVGPSWLLGRLDRGRRCATEPRTEPNGSRGPTRRRGGRRDG